MHIIPNPMTEKEEGNSEMGGGNCASANHGTRPYYFRMCKRKSIINIECLPDDLVVNILLRVPAQDIHDNARLVCKKWYDIINSRNFIYAHLQHSTFGLLIPGKSWSHCQTFVALRQGRIEKSKLRYSMRNRVLSSCNGLILLEYKMKNKHALYIVNPITKQQLVLPPLCNEKPYRASCGLAYAAASMVYKVLVAYTYDNHGNSKLQRCAILTVGVDNSWRHLNIVHLSHEAKEGFHYVPAITEGYVHWSKNSTSFLTLNVESENITETFFPQVHGDKRRKCYFSTGKYLSLLIACRRFSWEVWEMKPEIGECTKLPSIDMEAHKCTFKRFGYDKQNRLLVPLGWLKYREVLVFGSFTKPIRTLIAYNVSTQEIDLFKLASYTKLYGFRIHMNSLGWLGGC